MLDQEMPGWADKIDLDVLKLSNGDMCVLGQLFSKPRKIPAWQASEYGSIADAVESGWTEKAAKEKTCVANYALGRIVITKRLGGSPAHADLEYAMISHGFLLGNLKDEFAYSTEGWNMLDELWSEQVAKRQKRRKT
jgi:hypothetical protein